jgi:sugar-phosphatase
MQIQSGTLITTHALLFDMDGTLVDSTAAVELIWGRWAQKHGLVLQQFAHRMHGRRAVDIMSDLAPAGIDLDEEVAVLDDDELKETDGIKPIPGAAELIASLPRGSWALVTSARPPLARARMEAAGLPMPEIVVTSSDVTRGKPHPDCFQLALERTGLAPSQAIVFEDASAGLAAGKAAGCRTVALATTTPSSQLDHEDWLPDLRSVVLDSVLPDGRLQLRIR